MREMIKKQHKQYCSPKKDNQEAKYVFYTNKQKANCSM